MAKHIFFTVRNEAIRAYLEGKSEIRIFGIVIRIQHAHSNQYQVILPDGGEIIRIVDHGNRKLAVYTV